MFDLEYNPLCISILLKSVVFCAQKPKECSTEILPFLLFFTTPPTLRLNRIYCWYSGVSVDVPGYPLSQIFRIGKDWCSLATPRI